MKKIILLAVAWLFPLSLNYAQWVSNYWPPSYTDIDFTTAKGLAVTVDNYGYCYVTGYAYNDLSGNNDILTIKYSQEGDTLWTRTYNGSDINSDDQGYGIKVDNSGNVYVVGQVAMVDKYLDVALLKYDPSGTLLWDKFFRGSDDQTPDVGLAATLDAFGYIYVTGYTTGNDGKTDIVIIKYNANGDKQWHRYQDGTEDLDSKGLAIAVDNLYNIYVTGYTNSLSGGTDIIVAKYNLFGWSQWVQTYNGTGNQEDKAFGIAADDQNNIYITGYAYIDHNGISNFDCVTLKYNSWGTLQWNQLFNGEANNEDKAFGIAADNVGGIYITGSSSRLNDGIMSTDYVTVKYSSGGIQQWASFYNGTGNGTDNASGIALVGTDYVVVTGSSWGTNENFDYATIKYSTADGSPLQVNTYAMTGNSEDIAKDIDASSTGSVFITGFSELIVESPVSPSAVSTLSLNWGENGKTVTIPSKFSLFQNYPNPFNPSTTIKFVVAAASNVKIVVYDMLGRAVSVLVNGHMRAGSYSVEFTPRNLASGVYFYELTADGYRELKKMTLIK